MALCVPQPARYVRKDPKIPVKPFAMAGFVWGREDGTTLLAMDGKAESLAHQSHDAILTSVLLEFY